MWCSKLFSQAEELIKREMVTMLHHDAVYNPTLNQQGLAPGKKQPNQRSVVNQAQHLSYLEQFPCHQCDEKEMSKVSCELLLEYCARGFP